MSILGAVDQYREYDRRIWILFTSDLIVAIGFSVVMPFLAIYLHDGLGVPMSIVGTVYLVGALMAALGSIVGGELSDRLGRRRVMLFSVGMRALAFFLVALSVAAGHGFIIISFLVIISWFFGSLFEPSANAMIADLVQPGRRLEAYGLLRVGVNIGWALGPMIGGFLAAYSYSSLFMLTAICSSASFVMILFWVSESMHVKKPTTGFSLKDITSVRSDRTFLYFCITSFILWILISQMSSTYSVFAKSTVGLVETQIGYLYSINGAMVAILQIPIARLLSTRKMTRALILGSLLYVVGYFIAGLAGGFMLLAICMIIITLGELVVSPTSMNMVANLSPEKERGRYMGVFSFFTATGWSLGPAVGGLLLDSIAEPIILWGAISTIGLVSAVGYAMLGRKLSPEADRAGTKDGNN
ncbi:MAG: MFS transporter [Methanomassiliicoccales archaeon]|nr:MFS transporter [Methanomassiliicoccales archaeon]NYT14818.1 MFS transporter [Methanomassiliicoccales archaeon]